MPGKPPLSDALPPPLPLPSVVPVAAPVPASDPVPRPTPKPPPAAFKPGPLPPPYRPPSPLPAPPARLPLPPPAGVSAIASPFEASPRVPLPAAIEGSPPLLAPEAGSAITVTSPGVIANSDRASTIGTFVGRSGGGGIAFSARSPWSSLLSGASEISSARGGGGTGNTRGMTGSATARAGVLLKSPVGTVSFGAAKGS